MVKYAKEVLEDSKCAKVAGLNVRAHFKNTYETAQAIKGMFLPKAKEYLEAVIERRTCVPFRRFNGGVGRTSHAKEFNHTQGRWPVKSCKCLLGLLNNLQVAAEAKNLTPEKMRLVYVMVNRARAGRRRTYKAHGRINPFMSSPCHIQIIAKEKRVAATRTLVSNKNKQVKFTNLTLRELLNLNLSYRRTKKTKKSKMFNKGKVLPKPRRILKIRETVKEEEPVVEV